MQLKMLSVLCLFSILCRLSYKQNIFLVKIKFTQVKKSFLSSIYQILLAVVSHIGKFDQVPETL